MTDYRDDVITRVEVERRIMAASDALEERTTQFENLSRAAATCEADYRYAHAQIVLLTASNGDRKMTVDERSARADAATAEEHRTYLIATAARNSCRESLLSLRSQLDALRSLCANVRALT